MKRINFGDNKDGRYASMISERNSSFGLIQPKSDHPTTSPTSNGANTEKVIEVAKRHHYESIALGNRLAELEREISLRL